MAMTQSTSGSAKATSIEVNDVAPISAGERHGKAWHLFTVWTTPNLEFATVFVGALAIGFGLFLGIGIKLVDFKIEFGRIYEGDFSRVILADEISPDSCRLWDIKTNDKLDKDRFRRDLGGEEERYADAELTEEKLAELDAICLKSAVKPMFIKRAAVKECDPDVNPNYVVQTVADTGAQGLKGDTGATGPKGDTGAPISGATGIAVVSTLPGTPDPNTVYIVTT